MAAVTSAGVSGTAPTPQWRVLVAPTRAFTELSWRAAPGLRALAAPHVIAAAAVAIAVASASRTDTQDLLDSLGAGGSAVGTAAVSATLALVTGAGILLTLVFGGAICHFIARSAGGRASLREGMGMYVVALAPIWVRNLVIAVLLLGPLDSPERLQALRYGDPFLLASGVLLCVGLRVTYGLSLRAAAVCALINTVGGIIIGAVTWT
ncbi:MAG TPA: YIP1 family protein [Nocardioides sp.]|nr:YIP1 family protein [Nocardioides sp.]